MFKMVVGHSDDIDADTAIAEALEQCAGALGGESPQGGLLFSAFDMDHAQLLAGINHAYPNVQLVGCTTDGEMSSVLGFQEDSIALALFASDVVDVTAGVGRDVSRHAAALPAPCDAPASRRNGRVGG